MELECDSKIYTFTAVGKKNTRRATHGSQKQRRRAWQIPTHSLFYLNSTYYVYIPTIRSQLFIHIGEIIRFPLWWSRSFRADDLYDLYDLYDLLWSGSCCRVVGSRKICTTCRTCFLVWVLYCLYRSSTTCKDLDDPDRDPVRCVEIYRYYRYVSDTGNRYTRWPLPYYQVIACCRQLDSRTHSPTVSDTVYHTPFWRFPKLDCWLPRGCSIPNDRSSESSQRDVPNADLPFWHRHTIIPTAAVEISPYGVIYTVLYGNTRWASPRQGLSLSVGTVFRRRGAQFYASLVDQFGPCFFFFLQGVVVYAATKTFRACLFFLSKSDYRIWYDYIIRKMEIHSFSRVLDVRCQNRRNSWN